MTKYTFFIGPLPKCMIILLMIDVLMLISHPTDNIYFVFLMTDIQYTQFLYKGFLKYALYLQVTDKIGNDFA